MENVRVMERRYRAGLSLPPIPICMDLRGRLDLDRDGNHRLAAARLAQLSTVAVSIAASQGSALRSRHGVGALAARPSSAAFLDDPPEGAE
jgi:hypothetical protein